MSIATNLNDPLDRTHPLIASQTGADPESLHGL
jgi:hypothetical protein